MSNEHVMRAKLRVTEVAPNDGFEKISLGAVCRSEGYPEDGSDENNTYAKFTPTADLRMVITNPALMGKIKSGDEFYVDFTRAC